MNRYLAIAVGAALGANARYLVGLWAGTRFGGAFPYGTFIVNASGSLLLGFLLSLTTERISMAPEMRLLLTVGFLGSYTTFSTYTVESLFLLRDSGLWQGLLNVFANGLAGLICALFGVYLSRLVR